MKPAVSVVIPLYNKEHYISQAIDSVLSQTVQDFELIIVNDGSKDQGPEIVNNYHDQRILLIDQKNQGVSVARNCGISVAKADIVAFLDADDEWSPNFLETILRLRQNYPSVGMYGTGYALYNNGKHNRDNIWKPDLEERILTSYFGESVSSGFPIIITSSFAAPRKLLREIGGYQNEFRTGQDHDLFGRLALFHEVAYSPKICAHYNAGAENNADIVHYIVEVPLETYLHTLSPDILASCLNEEDLPVYLDFWRLKTGARNIYSGYRKEGRHQLQAIQTWRFTKKKWIFRLLSYIPISLSRISPRLVRTVTHKMKLST